MVAGTDGKCVCDNGYMASGGKCVGKIKVLANVWARLR